MKVAMCLVLSHTHTRGEGGRIQHHHQSPRRADMLPVLFSLTLSPRTLLREPSEKEILPKQIGGNNKNIPVLFRITFSHTRSNFLCQKLEGAEMRSIPIIIFHIDLHATPHLLHIDDNLVPHLPWHPRKPPRFAHC